MFNEDDFNFLEHTFDTAAEMIEKLGTGLAHLKDQRLQASYVQWHAHDAHFIDGTTILEFERNRLEAFSPGPGMCFLLDRKCFDPGEVLEYHWARLVWRKNPWPKLASFVGSPLRSLHILEYQEPLGLRFTFDSGPLCIFGDNDETHWCPEMLPPWRCSWRETQIF